MEKDTVVNTDTREIDVKILFASALHEWRKMLAAAVILGLLTGGYSGYKTAKANAAANNASNPSTQQYLVSMNDINTKIANTTKSIQNIDAYMQTSVLANTDPYNATVTSASLSIVTAATESSATGNQIVQAYDNFIMNSIVYTSLTGPLSLSEAEVKELVNVESDLDSDSLVIKVIGNDAKYTEKVMNYVLDQVNSEASSIKSKYGDYTLIKTDAVTNVAVEESLIPDLPTTGTNIPASSNRVMAKSLSIEQSMKTLLTTQQKTQATLAATGATGTKGLIKSIAKNGALGFIGGLIIMLLFYLAKYALGGKIISEEDMKKIYGMKVLSVLPMEPLKKTAKFDVIARRKMDSAYGIATDICVEKAMMNIMGYAEGMNSILLVGTDVKQDLHVLQAKLQALNSNMKITVSTNVNLNAEELSKLKAADGVIFAAQRDATRIDDLTKSVETVKNWNKAVVGCIVL